ncbi:MAG: MCE family protein [Verrucomicrobia bacterium]|nr:MCE family protein [Verrucomicrobiota bacterium]
MQIIRNEVRTGILVLLTIGLAVGAVLYLSSPGLFRPLHVFRVYFDNASGIKPGATVMLAGRKIGIVQSIQSPVPLNERPPGHPNYEALVTVEVAADAQIYKETNVTMRTFGLLADLVIDFTQGDPLSGLAKPSDSFVGVRAPDLGEFGPQVIQRLDPALRQAEATLAELQRTATNLTEMTATDSPLLGTIKSFDAIGGNLKGMTSAGGSIDIALKELHRALDNVDDATAQLNKDRNLEKTLANFNASSERLKFILNDLQGTMNTALPRVNAILADFGELSGRLKSQPWRLVWPNTIKYDQPPAQPQPTPRAKATPRRRSRE